MKKSIAIGLFVTLVVGLVGAIPVFAKGQPMETRNVFEADLVPTGVATHTLEKGEVYVRADDCGTIKVEIEGVNPPGETYDVVMVYRTTNLVYPIGQITTDYEGHGVLNTSLSAAGIPAGTYVGIRFRLSSPSGDQFASGFVWAGPPGP